jgi:23S rRNA (cytosine1962-C5)-methyltransferase
MNFVYLKSRKDKPVRHHHPWVFSGAVGKIEGSVKPGEVVGVKDANGGFLAWGYYNPHSQIVIRLLEWQEKSPVDEDWWRNKLAASVARRGQLLAGKETDSFRLVHGEADFLPGLVVDKYGDFLAVQSQTAGIDRVKTMIADALNEILKPAGIYERSDLTARKLEGLGQSSGLLCGIQPPDLLETRESGFRFLVNLQHGQKTGFYLDQRENRQIVASFARGKTVLDTFCYSGAFGIHALAAGATSVLSIDSSPASLELLKKNYAINGFNTTAAELIQGDVFESIRNLRDQNRTFDMLILDPPKLAPTKSQAAKALRAYKDLNLIAMQILNADGILATCSCSSGVAIETFQQMVAWAATDAGREVQILRRLSQGEDHPVRLAFPESQYLKGLVCRVL